MNKFVRILYRNVASSAKTNFEGAELE